MNDLVKEMLELSWQSIRDRQILALLDFEPEE